MYNVVLHVTWMCRFLSSSSLTIATFSDSEYTNYHARRTIWCGHRQHRQRGCVDFFCCHFTSERRGGKPFFLRCSSDWLDLRQFPSSLRITIFSDSEHTNYYGCARWTIWCGHRQHIKCAGFSCKVQQCQRVHACRLVCGTALYNSVLSP